MSSNGANQALFACTKCMKFFPFNELSTGKQLCKDCKGCVRSTKCTYCRTEFQQESKSSHLPICEKCTSCLTKYGKPNNCEYCNITAAFIGRKCQRCVNSEKKYGTPVDCDSCKQRCAFDRKDAKSRESKDWDGKMLCWLCTISLKKALAKAKQNDASIKHTNISSLTGGSKSSSSSQGRNKIDPDFLLNLVSKSNNNMDNSDVKPDVKKIRLDNGSDGTSMSDNLSEVTLLKEKVSSLQKVIKEKEADIMAKNRRISTLNGEKSALDRDLRKKLEDDRKTYEKKIDTMSSQILQLKRELLLKNKKPGKKESPTDSPLGLML